jgi:hypothetical protein
MDVNGAAPGGFGAPLSADLEALLPRWRRPSLLQARKADPIRDSTPAARLTFDQGLVGKLDGRERRTIRYSLVRLLDSPDELRAAEIGYLDQGDEVQLLEKYGAYWLVLCPDGRQGWVPKTLTPGMKVSAVIHPLKDGTHGGQFMAVTLPDGTTKGNPNAAAGANAGAN